MELYADGYAARKTILEELDELGYRKTDETPTTGEYYTSDGGIVIAQRGFPSVDGWQPPHRLEILFSGRTVRNLSIDGRETERARIEPAQLASFFGDDRKEIRPVDLADLPEHLIQAVLAAEDAKFFQHRGLSWRGIARAAWVNMRGMEFQQGGSTLTQQLVKNLFLTHERTLSRKAREAVLAILVDMRSDKDDILSAYLNEIYWGISDGVNLMGVGSASRAYFGKQPQELTLGESALLAGMIRSPGSYSPTAKPEPARIRRDQVLDAMARLQWIDEETRARAVAEPVDARPLPPIGRRAPHFVGAVATSAERRYGVSDLETGGYALLSTLDWRDQRRAEEAVSWGLEALEKGWQKNPKTDEPLQSALVSIHPKSGAVLAYVGGRDYGSSQFDRAIQARRQAGSAFKPVVYAAAFEQGLASPASLLSDDPLTVRLASDTWSPKNSNGENSGLVTVRTAFEKSLNVATARLALDVGLESIVDLAHAMGVEGRLDPYPALALGAFEVTPVEMSTVYATLANGGVRPAVHVLEAVLHPDGSPVNGRSLPEPVRVLSEQSSYLVTTMMQGVFDRGTATSARTQGLRDRLAGKTGTTNGRRDSWFGGFSPERTTMVWVGYDNNTATSLSGARAALPIWTRFTSAVRPSSGYGVFRMPLGISTAVIDTQTGALATSACTEILTEAFLSGHGPNIVCPVHARRFSRWADNPYPQQDIEPGAPGAVEVGEAPPVFVDPDPQARRGPVRWLKKVFGRKGRKSGGN